jgi:hypothetical protein
VHFGCCGVPTKKGAPRPLRLPRDGLRAPAQTGMTVAPGIAFCYAYRDHKGSPCGSGAGDGAPAKVLSSALFFCLCDVNPGGLCGSTVGLQPEASRRNVQPISRLPIDHDVTENPPRLHRCFVPFFGPDLASLEGTFVSAVRIARSARRSAVRGRGLAAHAAPVLAGGLGQALQAAERRYWSRGMTTLACQSSPSGVSVPCSRLG